MALFIPIQGTLIGIPDPSDACLAGDWPKPAEIIFPKITSSI